MFKKIKEIRERARYLRFRGVHMRSRKGIERWQVDHLRTLIARASENVPLFAKLFTQHGFAPTSLASIHDLKRLPITYKATYVGKEVEEYTDNSQSRLGYWVTTSGTSGRPFAILRNPQIYAPLYVDLMLYRFLFDGKPWRFVRSEKVVRIWPKASYLENSEEILIADLLTDTEKTLRHIGAINPDIIETYAGILHVIAEGVKKYRISLRPRYAISCAEQMTPALRAVVSEVLGCEVFNRYGMEEFGAIATECSAHDGLHVHSESFIVEIVDDHGAPMPDGNYGRIVITDVFNSQMPFIRYDTGDRGKISWQRCSCGQGAPRLWLEGRYSAFLMLGGRRIHHLEFDVALEVFMNSIVQYQVLKEEHDKIVIKIVPAPAFDEAAQKNVIARVRSLVGPDVRISIQSVDSIPKSARGKSQIVADMTQ